MSDNHWITDYTEPDIKWTMVDLSGTNDPDTGDIYSGLDRFGRTKDCRWYDYGSSADVDRIKYGYDRASNSIWRQNTVAEALSAHFDELYGNDLIHRLKDLTRGTLNAQKDGITDESFAECWSLDSTGNWKKYLEDSDGDGTWDLNQSQSANKVNEITDITESTGPAWVTPGYCKAAGIKAHPARFPAKLPEFFIRFLTDPGDTVVDIFAGSNTTGSVAEAERRNWLAFDERREYVATSAFRFLGRKSTTDELLRIYRMIRDGETVKLPLKGSQRLLV